MVDPQQFDNMINWAFVSMIIYIPYPETDAYIL